MIVQLQGKGEEKSGEVASLRERFSSEGTGTEEKAPVSTDNLRLLEYEIRLNELGKERDDAKNEIDCMKSQLHANEQQHSKHEVELSSDQLRTQIKQLLERLADAEKGVKEAQHREKLAKEELTRFEESIEQKCKENAEFGVIYEDMKQRFEPVERNCEIREQSERSEKLAEEKAKELEKIQEKFAAIEPQIISLLDERESMTKLITESQKQCETAIKDRDAMKIETEKMRSYVDTKEKEMAQLQKSLADARREIGELTTTNMKLESRDMCQQHDQTINALQKKVNELQQEMAQNLTDLVNSKKEKLKIEELVKKQKDEIKKLQSEKKDSEKDRDRVQSSNKQSESEHRKRPRFSN